VAGDLEARELRDVAGRFLSSRVNMCYFSDAVDGAPQR
jgi:hypothetical protein